MCRSSSNLSAQVMPDDLARATKLYRGDLLEGLDVRDPAFEGWLLFERQRLRDQARDALARLLAHHLVKDASAQAGVAARRLLALDPLHETAHRALMQPPIWFRGIPSRSMHVLPVPFD